MSEHRTVAVIPGEPDAVFAYLASVETLPHYLSIVTSATRTGREDAVIAIQIAGVASTHSVWVRAYRDRRRLAWGTVDNSYRGEVLVSPPRLADDAGGGPDGPPAEATGEHGPVSLVTITLESDHHADGSLSSALERAASALSLAVRGAAVDR